jgi:hypothetical protein
MNLIITHNKERTLNKAIAISKKIGFKVHIVNDGPRHKTVIKGFKAASEFSDEWFAWIGGDHFLFDNALEELKKRIDNFGDNKDVWRISGWGFSYLWNRKKQMSPVIYRTVCAKDALRFSKDLNLQTLRPESYIRDKMKSKGYKYIVDDSLEVANTDYEQYYIDIYNKGYFQASKCKSKKRLRIFKRRINNIKKKDTDHIVFLHGINDFINKGVTDIYKKFNIKEKSPLKYSESNNVVHIEKDM